MQALVLEIVAGPECSPTHIRLRNGLLIGRAPDCDWVLPDAQVSRHHARIEWRSEQWQVVDLQSRVGTLLNDAQLPPGLATPLRVHDRLRIAGFRLRVRPEEAQALGRTSRFAGTGGGSTQVSMPVLAAEQRLELLVEYAAALAQAESLEALDQISASMLRRALSADVVCVLDRLDESVRALDPAAAELWLESEALVAAQSGGVVPTLASDGRAALTSALRVDGVAEAYVHAQFLKADPKIKSELAELMHAFTRLAGLSAGNVLRRAANERIARLQLDLTQARAVQARVQPAPVGERAAIRYAMHLHPGRLVAGDLCDVLDLDAERTVILLGDVAGAGVGAGFLMAAALAHLRASLEHTGSIEAAASSLNRFVAGIGGGQFVTLFMAECQRTSRSVRVIDAGHGHVRVIAPEGLRAVSLRGSVPLGVDAGASFQVEHLSLRSDERLLIYSDGVAELRNGQGETFGAAQLEAILKRSHDVETDISLTCAGLELFAGHVPEDDATLLSVAWRSS